MLKFARFLKQFKKEVLIGPVFKLTEAVFELIVPLVMAQIIDVGIANGDRGYVLRMGGVMVLLGLVGLGCALICQYCAARASQGFGTVLNVASSAGLLPGGPYMAGYYATKAYVVSLTRGIAEELREQHSPVYVCALCPGPVDTEFNDRAGVVFALKGISPALCVEEAMRGMLRGKTIIVPSALMRAATTAQHFVPTPLLMPIMARQQKKKLGGSTPTQEH